MFALFKDNWRKSVDLRNADLFPLEEATRPVNILGGLRHSKLPKAYHQRRATHAKPLTTDLAWLDDQPAPQDKLQGYGLYGGPFLRHYGHFLAESVHRLWAWSQAPERYDYVAIAPQSLGIGRPLPSSPEEMHLYHCDLLAYLNIPLEKVRLINKPVTAEHIKVPMQASLYGELTVRPTSYAAFWQEQETRFFQSYSGSLPAAADRIYVSRSRFVDGGTLLGEHYLETLLADEGFLILHPEALPLAAQLHLYRNAKLLVFSEGSALHTTELLGPMQAEIVCIMRRPDPRMSALWQSVLHGRSLQLFDQVRQLPTLSLMRNGTPALQKSVTLLDADAFVRYMRDSRFARLDSFDLARFHLAEAADLARYILQVNIMNTIGFEKAGVCLSSFRAALKDHPNPYLTGVMSQEERHQR